MGDPLHVLVVESHRGLASVAASTLEAAGHQVHRCFGPDDRGFPCAGMKGEPCPVEQGVDVVFLQRAGMTPTPTPLEDGVLCGLRDGVPVVEARRSVVDPYGAYVSGWVEPSQGQWDTEWADNDAAGEGGVVDAVEAAALERDSSAAAAVLDVLEPLMETSGLVREDVDCRITRDGRAVEVLVETDRPVDSKVAQALAVRALDGIRTSGIARGRVGVQVRHRGAATATATDTATDTDTG